MFVLCFRKNGVWSQAWCRDGETPLRRGVGELECDLLTSTVQGDLAWYIMLEQSPPYFGKVGCKSTSRCVNRPLLHLVYSISRSLLLREISVARI